MSYTVPIINNDIAAVRRLVSVGVDVSGLYTSDDTYLMLTSQF